jgi:hypothetical protein
LAVALRRYLRLSEPSNDSHPVCGAKEIFPVLREISLRPPMRGAFVFSNEVRGVNSRNGHVPQRRFVILWSRDLVSISSWELHDE